MSFNKRIDLNWNDCPHFAVGKQLELWHLDNYGASEIGQLSYEAENIGKPTVHLDCHLPPAEVTIANHAC